jgi:hypothetical protein
MNAGRTLLIARQFDAFEAVVERKHRGAPARLLEIAGFAALYEGELRAGMRPTASAARENLQ